MSCSTRRPRNGPAGGMRPTIDVYLYDIREDLRRRERGIANEYDDGTRAARGTATALLQAVLPADRLDAAAGGRAPAAVVPAGLLPQARVRSRPTCSPGRSPTRAARPADHRPAPSGGPLVRRRLVRPGRRAQAFARPRGVRAHRGPAASRPAGPHGGEPPASRSAASTAGRPRGARGGPPASAWANRQHGTGPRPARSGRGDAVSGPDTRRPAVARRGPGAHAWPSTAAPGSERRTTRSGASTSPTRWSIASSGAPSPCRTRSGVAAHGCRDRRERRRAGFCAPARARCRVPGSWCAGRALPDLDCRFEKLYGYLNDDVTRRRASIGLALELAGVAASLRDSAPYAAAGTLVAQSLVLVEDADRPLLTRGLRVPDRVAAHLLGDTGRTPPLPPCCWTSLATTRRSPGSPTRSRGAGVVHLREHDPAGPGDRGGRARATGVPALAVDLAVLDRLTHPATPWSRSAARHCCAEPAWSQGRSSHWSRCRLRPSSVLDPRSRRPRRRRPLGPSVDARSSPTP